MRLSVRWAFSPFDLHPSHPNSHKELSTIAGRLSPASWGRVRWEDGGCGIPRRRFRSWSMNGFGGRGMSASTDSWAHRALRLDQRRAEGAGAPRGSASFSASDSVGGAGNEMVTVNPGSL